MAKRESLIVEKEEVQARVKELMAQYAGKDIDLERLREVVEEELLTEKVMDWLEEHATIELVPEGSLILSSDEETQEQEQAPADSASVANEDAPDERSQLEDTSEGAVADLTSASDIQPE